MAKLEDRVYKCYCGKDSLAVFKTTNSYIGESYYELNCFECGLNFKGSTDDTIKGLLKDFFSPILILRRDIREAIDAEFPNETILYLEELLERLK